MRPSRLFVRLGRVDGVGAVRLGNLAAGGASKSRTLAALPQCGRRGPAAVAARLRLRVSRPARRVRPA